LSQHCFLVGGICYWAVSVILHHVRVYSANSLYVADKLGQRHWALFAGSNSSLNNEWQVVAWPALGTALGA